MEAALRKILRTIAVELGDEFDQNFTRQAFFSEAWQRRTSPINGKYNILAGPQQTLRKSIRRKVEGSAVSFASDLPYAAIHNEGGEIVVTQRMKGYFWYRYRQATGALGRKKDGSLRRNKKNLRLTTEAEFYKAMALKKNGSVIKIPRRRFLGMHPDAEKLVRTVIDAELSQWAENNAFQFRRKDN